MSRPRAGAILLAAGSSQRMRGLDKTLAPLGGLPVAAHSLKAFAACPLIDEVVIVCAEANQDPIAELAAVWGGGKVVAIVRGGAQRRDSVAAGLQALGPVELVAVHDIARPLVTERMERSDRAAEVREAVSRLEPTRRLTLLLREVEEMSYEEIAEATGVAVGTVRSRLARGREDLRRLLGAAT